MRPSTLWARGGDFLRSYWTPAGKQALGNLIGLVVCTGVSQGCALGVLLLLTHGLPQEGFGAVIFALNVQSYLVAVGTFGLTTIVVRDLAQHPDRRAETITAYLTIVTVASVLVGIITAVVAAVVPVSTDERVMLWCVAAGNVAACLNLNPLFDAAHKQALAAALMVPADLLALGAVAGLYLTHSLTVPLVGIVILGKWAVTATFHALNFAWPSGVGGPSVRWTGIRRTVLSGWKLAAANIAQLIPLTGLVVAARMLCGPAEAAIVGLAYQVGSVYLLLTWLVLRVAQPHINGPYGLTGRFVRQLGLSLGMILLGLGLGVVAAGGVLIFALLPDSYRSGFVPVVLITVGICVFMITYTIGLYLTRYGREGSVRTASVVTATTFLALVAWQSDRIDPVWLGADMVVATLAGLVFSVVTLLRVARAAA